MVFLSACAGAGLTTLLVMCALTLRERGHACALMDMDVEAGGMDVVLGLEADSGLRLSDVEAPLGRIDSAALDHELPKWEAMSVLSCDPWNGATPQWWDVEAALGALGRGHELVLVDAAGGQCMGQVGLLAGQPCVLLVELSVLGLARTRVLLRRLAQGMEREDEAMGKLGERGGIAGKVLLVGIEPRGFKGAPPVSQAEAEEFLGRSFLGCVRPQAQLAADVLAGMGIERPPRAYRKPLAALAERIEAEIGLEAPAPARRSFWPKAGKR
ncbi:hypothetical protein KIMH_14640 [Bombiscardovia apis]|uniref:Uncharacterized protein n=1 Tax=Bombiscardovia apis TaxID=2932182 RepID=A0ABN6SJ30_9BIFI|nr:hypothetical protein KIMH_14640 [Bombiscardovia apis]